MNRIIAGLILALFCATAQAQQGTPGFYGTSQNGGGGGGGGGSGTVTSVATSCGLTGGTITTSGTISGTSVVGNNGSFISGSTYTVQGTTATHPDCGTTLVHTGSTATTVTVAQAGSTGFATGFGFAYMNASTQSDTIDFTTSTLLPGSVSSIVVPPNTMFAAQADGTNGNWELMWASAGLAGEIPDCHGSSNALLFNGTTKVFSCNTISGSGTVNSGTANQFSYYASTGTAVSGDANLTDNGTIIAAAESINVEGNALVAQIANAASTGTTLHSLAKLTGAPSTAVLTATTDTTGIVGIVAGGAGTTGNAQIALEGIASCNFDATSVAAGDYVQNSSTTAGDCHDAGSTLPTSGGRIVGRVLASGSGSTTYNVSLFGPGINAVSSSGGGGYTFFANGEASALSASGAKYYIPNSVGINGSSSSSVSTNAALPVSISSEVLRAFINTAPSTGNNVVFTWTDATSSTTLATCTVAAATQTCNATGSISASAGDQVTISVNPNSTNSTGIILWSVGGV